MQHNKSNLGFTLIELSIILVIAGLIIGGILVGKDLISAAAVRDQIAQIEKFQQATNTFYVKYGYLPGDITPAAVSRLGFTVSPVRLGVAGEGDGNGELDGSNGTSAFDYVQTGENVFFWEDLSANTNLIEGDFSSVANAYLTSCASSAACSAFFPYSKLDNGSFVYVYSGYAASGYALPTGNGPNFFGLSFISSTRDGNVAHGAIPPAPALTVKQAYNIDTKVDDGVPTSGKVLAQYLDASTTGKPAWSANGTTPSQATCYDTSSGTAAYSISYQNGKNVNCGLSFQFQ